jgi:hypothetical protein
MAKDGLSHSAADDGRITSAASLVARLALSALVLAKMALWSAFSVYLLLHSAWSTWHGGIALAMLVPVIGFNVFQLEAFLRPFLCGLICGLLMLAVFLAEPPPQPRSPEPAVIMIG